MNHTTLLSLMLMISLSGLTKVATGDLATEEFKQASRNCAAYSSPGKIAQCAGIQYDTKVITPTVFKKYLQVAMSKLEADTTAYSIGFTTGSTQEIFIGAIADPMFTAGFNYPYMPKHLLHDSVRISMGKVADSRPVLLFVVGKIPNVPEFEHDAYLTQPEGDEMSKTIYKYKSAESLKYNQVEQDCGKLQKWIVDSDINRWENIVIIMPAHMWCTRMQNGVARVVVADITALDVTIGKHDQTIYKTNWEVDPKNTFGEVPIEWITVFM